VAVVELEDLSLKDIGGSTFTLIYIIVWDEFLNDRVTTFAAQVADHPQLFVLAE